VGDTMTSVFLMCVFVFVVCIVIVLISIGFCILMMSIFGGVLLLLIKIDIHLLIAILSHRFTSMFIFGRYEMCLSRSACCVLVGL